ncbi:DUF6338 family protein [Humibacillus xanthopallidus]|uniref:Uncharacterized protein n=1 Tax=Humibacillus xanthopallidus TaxID=412689 RepID=A0A543I3I8_9MICO|nr:DUF6338 family protein [Humibacillus xanthopallidus]TQM65153.1 hypothetical protein FBY41_1538 [Humibacillus xanthopallidus]
MPTSGAALLIALAMVPGYLYLELTRERREPYRRSAVGEVLELLFIGLGTTGLAFTMGFVFAPGTALAVLTAVQKPPGTLTPEDLRYIALVTIGVLVLSVLFALLAAAGARRLMKRRYSPSIMKATFGRTAPGHVPVAQIRLGDGSTVEGVLHGYQLDVDEASRGVALKAPIARHRDDQTPVQLPIGYFVALGSDIQHLTLTQVPDPGATVTARKGSARRVPGSGSHPPS